jgi:hypothetical protein
VYSLGPGSKKYVWVTIPGGVTQTLVNETEVSLKLYIFSGESDVFANTKPTVIGSIPSSEGPHRIAIEALSFGVVRIGEATTDNDPPNITRVYPSLLEGQNVCPGLVTVGADTDEPAICKYVIGAEYGSKQNWDDWTEELEGRALSHYKNLYLTVGTYTYYFRCIDYYDNVMHYEDSANTTFTVATPCIGGGPYAPGGPCYGMPEDLDSPSINLSAPVDWGIATFPVVEFNYTTTDTTSGIDYCVVNISTSTGAPSYGLGELYSQAYDSDASEIGTNSLSFAFNDKGIFLWNVFCVDDSCTHNQGVSGYRTLNVSKTFFEAFLTSCAGHCGLVWNMNGGDCNPNPNFCQDNCGLPYNPNHDCYAGLNASLEYCQRQGFGDACCCKK